MSWITDFFTELKTPYRGMAREGYHGIKTGYKLGFIGGSPFIIGGAAFGFAFAKPRHGVSQAAGEAVGYGMANVLGGIVGGMLGGVPGAYIGSFAAGIIGGEKMSKAVADVVQPMIDFGYNVNHVNFGGNFKDSNIAITMRQRAAQELSGSLINARNFLGQESAFFKD